jgi:hypothetical protein
MEGTMRATMLLWLVPLGATGCVRSYADAPALPYAEVPYVGPDGAAWPEERLALDDVAVHYRGRRRRRSPTSS